MKTVSIAVDLNALLTLRHDCTGCPKDERCCCAHYDICISTQEMQRMVAYLPQAAAYCPQLKTPDGFDNVFEQIARDLFRIDTTDDGLCVFAYHRQRETRCALHSVALDLSLPINTVKPETCLLWPLALSENAPYTLTVDQDAFFFRCNSPRAGRKTLHNSIHAIIAAVFGPRFTHEVENALREGPEAPQLLLEVQRHPLICKG